MLRKKKELKEFSKWILDVGDGKVGGSNDGNAVIDIPEEFLITDVDHPIEAISNEIYGDTITLQEKKDSVFFPRESYTLSNQ